MDKITSTIQLKEAISRLEHQQAYEMGLLKQQFYITYESFKPINILKGAFKEVVSSSEIKDSFLNTAIGLAVGYLSKKIFISGSNNPLTKILGAILQTIVAHFVTKNSETIKLTGAHLWQSIFNNHEKSDI